MTNKIVFTLQVDFAMPEATVMNFFSFCEYLLWVQANEVNYLAVSSQGVHRSQRRLEYVGNARITSLVGK